MCGDNLPLPLIERSREEVARAIRRRVSSIKGVQRINRLNVRVTGKRIDADLYITLDSSSATDDPHRVALSVEKSVKDYYPSARTTVHTQPLGDDLESVWNLVKDVSDSTPGSRGVHNIHIQSIDGKLCIDLHLEVSANMTVKQAHDVASKLEEGITNSNKQISDVNIHIETASDRVSREIVGVEEELESYINDLINRFPDIKDVCGVTIRRFGKNRHVALRCRFSKNLPIEKAHQITKEIETAIRGAYPDVERVDIHEEPA